MRHESEDFDTWRQLTIPDGIRLVYLPPYSRELQPAETLWALVDESIVNKHPST
jgi:transposase